MYRNKTTKTAQAQKGFTLIEVLVVMTIIGILASVILPSVNSARESGRNAERISELKHFTNILELYRFDNNQYPPHGDVAAGCSVDTCLEGLSDDLMPDYTGTIPTDPTYGSSDLGYQYCRPNAPNDTSFTLLIPSDSGPDGWCSLKHQANVTGDGCWHTGGVPDYGWCDDEL